MNLHLTGKVILRILNCPRIASRSSGERSGRARTSMLCFLAPCRASGVSGHLNSLCRRSFRLVTPTEAVASRFPEGNFTTPGGSLDLALLLLGGDDGADFALGRPSRDWRRGGESPNQTLLARDPRSPNADGQALGDRALTRPGEPARGVGQSRRGESLRPLEGLCDMSKGGDRGRGLTLRALKESRE